MSSESCIYPSCNCRGYQDPGHPKGSLLLLMRLGCKKCGHHGSEHRRLTVVDKMVREEVERVMNVRCSHIIPHDEISRSPIFKPYDPIPIPYDQEECSGIQCTCPGFHITSLVRLWQSFRSYGLSTAVSLLPSIICDSCSHTLQDHQPRPGGATSLGHAQNNTIGREERATLSSGVISPQLILKASATLPLTPLEGCVQILPAAEKTAGEISGMEEDENKEERRNEMTLVTLHSPSEGNLHILVSSVDLTIQEAESNNTEDKEEEIPIDLNGLTKTSTSIDKVMNSTVEEVEAKVTPLEVCGPGRGRQRGRKRRCATLPPTRKSARLQKQTKKEKEKANRAEEEKKEARRAEEEKKRCEKEAENMRVICRRVVEFTSSLEDRNTFTHYPLPKEITKCGVEMMAAARGRGGGGGGRGGGGGGLILSLGTASGQIFVVAMTTVDEKLVWIGLDDETSSSSDKQSVKCMSWLEKSPGQFHLCVGYDGGSLIVWKLTRTDSQLEQSVVSRLQSTEEDITMICWDPNHRILVAGSLVGEVLFYMSGQKKEEEEKEARSEYQLKQRLSCAYSTITCSTWMNNGSILAVGGTDDSIHILQRKQPSTRKPPPNTKSSLLSYFKPVDADKFVYTHWLRGHCSFVSSLLPVGSTTLLSLGWDNHLLYWRGIDPIRPDDREVLPIEDNLPQTGFRLGPAAAAEYLPLSVCGVGGFGVIVLFITRTRHVDFTYYTLRPINTSSDY